jgi:hypothetical protein
VSEVFVLDQLLANRLQAGRSYLEFLRVPAMSAGVYVLPAGATDQQQPHREGEIYYVVRGKAKMRIGVEERSIGEGSVIFVEAGLEHRFVEVEDGVGGAGGVCAAGELGETIGQGSVGRRRHWLTWLVLFRSCILKSEPRTKFQSYLVFS